LSKEKNFKLGFNNKKMMMMVKNEIRRRKCEDSKPMGMTK
jgi:hypothetical protein